MTEEEAQETRELKEQLLQKEQRIAELESRLIVALLRIEELEKQKAKNSHNSSLPPSRDHEKHKGVGQRPKSAKRSGGQQGHQGHTLVVVEQPDEVIVHRPLCCASCQQDLSGERGQLQERRQVHDLPQVRLQVQEHQRMMIRCPGCQHLSSGTFPEEVKAPVQYGPGVRAIAVYLWQYQLLPLGRIRETLWDLMGATISEGSVQEWTLQAGRKLQPTGERLREQLRQGKLIHVDETGVRLRGLGRWVHVSSNRWLTWYQWHPRRGTQAVEAIGVLPQFSGRAMHDRLNSYDHYPCTHSVCGAHLLRDLLFAAEQEKQSWTKDMLAHLRQMVHVTNRWREQGASHLPASLRQELVAQYFALLAQGYAAQSPPAPPKQKGGRPKQSLSKNLLDALLLRAEEILGFVEDLSVPFTNNLAERDLRMLKVQQKIAGTFRSDEGLTTFCLIRSYLSTMRKQGRRMLASLRAVFEGTPFSIAWEPGT